jgi:hypothetical protein
VIKINLPSGSILDVTLMPFEIAWEVSQAVLKEVKKLDIETAALDLFNRPKEADVGIGDLLKLKDPICEVLSNPVFVENAKKCFVKCTYKSLRIDDDTFESVEARGDFIHIVYHVLSTNISPFFKSLDSFLPKK